MPPTNPHGHNAAYERATFCSRCRALRTVKRDADWWDTTGWNSPIGWWIYSLFGWVIWSVSFLIPMPPTPWRCTICGEAVPVGERWMRGRGAKAPSAGGRAAGEAGAASAKEHARGYCAQCRRDVAAIRVASGAWTCVECHNTLPFVKPTK